MRSAIAAVLTFSLISFVAFSANDTVAGQIKADTPKASQDKTDTPKDAPADKPKDKPADPPKQPEKSVLEEKFDQKKADLETLKAAHLPFEGKALLRFFQQHTVTDAERAHLTELIGQLGDDDFDRREQASAQIEEFGVSAIGLLRQAERTTNPEVLRRCERCLKDIEKVPTRTLACAAARLIAELKPDEAMITLLNYLPIADDDAVADDVRSAIASLAMKDGKPDPVLLKALESRETIKRSAAAEAFARNGDKNIRAAMRKLMATENEIDIKLRIATALVSAAKDKEVVEDMIKLMTEAPVESGWRAEEILVRLAGDKTPMVSLGGAQASRDKARSEWMKWWKDNEKTIDLAKLDELEPTLGYTLIIEMDARNGVGGRVKEISPDGKVRWEIKNVEFPTDAIVLPGNRVIVAEQNNNRVSERETATGKVIWETTTLNQPIGLQRQGNGNIVVVGRQQLVEWDHDRKALTTITRQQFDIVAGAKLRNGNFAVYTQQGLIVIYDKSGKEQLDSFRVGTGRGGNYFSTMQVLPNGRVLITQPTGVAEVDLANKKADVMVKYPSPMSAQKLPNGNILVSSQNTFQVAELDPKTSKPVWEYKQDNNNNNNFYKPWRAKRR
jgi:PQQ-like domain